MKPVRMLTQLTAQHTAELRVSVQRDVKRTLIANTFN